MVMMPSLLARSAFVAGAIVLIPVVAGAQQLQIRGAARVLEFALDSSLGINPDSLRLTGRGVYYVDVQRGTGDSVVTGNRLEVHYVGMLTDGTRFAATDRSPFVFHVGEGRVIPGWEDGVIGMRVGGRRQLVIPAFLAYGRSGGGKVPPDATLVFDITLIGRR